MMRILRALSVLPPRAGGICTLCDTTPCIGIVFKSPIEAGKLWSAAAWVLLSVTIVPSKEEPVAQMAMGVSGLQARLLARICKGLPFASGQSFD